MRFGDQFGRRILISSKRPRLETEALKWNLAGDALDRELALRGFNVSKLRKSSEEHSRAMDSVQQCLSKRNLKYSVEYTKSLCSATVEKSDLVICLGGDGTLLETSQFVRTSRVPVLGVNSDPESSVGKLLSVSSYENFSQALDKISRGDFSWLLRSRIAADLIDPAGNRSACESVLALNEVLLAEREVCRPSRHHIVVNDDDKLEDFGLQRSCGILIATGSGSTAWIHSANAIHAEDAQLLLNCSYSEAMRFATLANDKMKLPSTSQRMSFFIREILSSADNNLDDPVMKKRRRGVASKLSVLAFGFDMCIFQDGLSSPRSVVSLEHGTNVEFKIAPEQQSLRTFIVS